MSLLKVHLQKKLQFSMKKVLVFLSFLVVTASFSQTTIKFNGATALIGVPNIGVETSIGEKITFQLDATASFWESVNGDPYRFFILTPEVRYHFQEKFDGLYLGANVSGGTFKLTKYGYEGTGTYQRGFNVIFGVTVGYQWKLNEKWGLDLFIGGGHQEAIYKGFDREGNRYDHWIHDWNKSGEMVLYRGGLMISYKIK
jgi:hypothetical protein